MGRRQVVRHELLVLACAGSNPAGPAKNSRRKNESFFILKESAGFEMERAALKRRAVRSVFKEPVPWKAQVANVGDAEGADTKSATVAENPAGPAKNSRMKTGVFLF